MHSDIACKTWHMFQEKSISSIRKEFENIEHSFSTTAAKDKVSAHADFLAIAFITRDLVNYNGYVNKQCIGI